MQTEQSGDALGRGLGTSTIKDFIKRRGDAVVRKLVDEVWGTTGQWSPQNKFTDWPDEKKAALIIAMKHYDHMIDSEEDDDPGALNPSRVLVAFGGDAGAGKTLVREFFMSVLESTGFKVKETKTASEDDFYVMLDAVSRTRLAALNTRGDGASAEELPQDGSKIARQQRAVEECRAAHAAFQAALEKAEYLGVQICSTHVSTDFDGKPTLVVNDYKTEPDYLVKL